MDSVGTAAFVGRARESERVRSVLESARAGHMAALLVSGDAGVGKTLLVDRICAEAGHDDVLVLRGVCLPMRAAAVPLMPLRTAFRRLPEGVAPPALDDHTSAGGFPVVVDAWLDRNSRDRAVVLLVDDVQWADEASLDVLTYVLAGPSDRSLAVLLTLRRDEVGVGHPVRRWLADVRRLPCLAELDVGPFDRPETGDQLHMLLGASPHESLVTEVQARTGGNAYLNRLLVEGLPPDARALPPGLPEDLRSAVLRPWERLSRPARELVLAVAIGGEVADGTRPGAGRRPVGRATRGRAPAPSGCRRRRGARPLTGGRVLVPPPAPGRGFGVTALWGRTAQDARSTGSSLRGRTFHGRWRGERGRDRTARRSGRTPLSRRRTRRSLCLDPARARGGRAAGRPPGRPRRSSSRRSTCILALREPAAPVTELLVRLKDAAALLGQHEVEHGAVEALLDATDETERPLLVCELLVRREHLRFSTGRGFLRVEPVRRAAELSRPWPDSWQHGFALAEVAHASLWADEPDAQEAVSVAVEAAEAIGHPRVTAYAFAAAAMGTEYSNRPGGPALAARGVQGAAEARDWWGFVHASLWEANTSEHGTSPEWAASVRKPDGNNWPRWGVPIRTLPGSPINEGSALFQAGDWRAATELLRVALGSDPGTSSDVQARLLAALLAVAQGRQHEAEDHLSRAEELSADTTAFRAWSFDAVRALVRTGAGDARGAYAAAMTGLLSPGVPPTMCEWLCPLAARALADLVAAAQGRNAHPGEDLKRLDDLVDRFPHVVPDGSLEVPRYRKQVEALDALYVAEVARARGDPDAVTHWRRAAELLDGALPWDAAYAAYRAGEAVLVHREGSRDDAAALLRRAAALATELRAEPVLRDVTALAAAARVPLATVEAIPDDAAGTLPGLTNREREILTHIVAGRTYGEIARALFLSEKTVSSHVSNILRKTGSANRVDLARRAQHAANRGSPH